MGKVIGDVEMYQIIDAVHGDPHQVLGIHIVPEMGAVIRTFIPQADVVKVHELGTQNVYEMDKVHSYGFFEVVVPNKDDVFKYEFEAIGYSGDSWKFVDPYRFLPVISGFDIHLFNAGNHYEIFEKLGAHKMEIDGVEGTLFAVWAPNAQRVSIIGDFNAWDGRRNPMRARESSGIWELFVPGVGCGDYYKYEVKSCDGSIVQKTDPYGNFQELRPGTASIVHDISRYQWNDGEWFVGKDKWDLNKPINIYEVHLGSWKRTNDGANNTLTYRDFAEHLVSYVKEMGYTHIELLPVEEHPFDGSWGYQVTGYFAPTSRFGNPDDFMYFVDTCHQNGIGVILDWVPAHFPKDSHGLAKFDGTCLYEHADPKKGEHPDWGTLIFNYGRNEVKNFLISNAIFWIEKYHIDGLRVDAVASMLYLDYGKKDGQWIANEYGGNENFEAVEFMKHMNSVILSKHPGVLMIAEESTAWPGISQDLQDNGVGFRLKWNMGWMNDFLTYIAKDPVHRKYHHGELTFSMVYAYSEHFVLVLSHDEVVHGKGSMINKMPGDYWQKFANLRAAYGFMYSHPGKKLLFMGSEFAQFAEWNEAISLDWHLLEFDKHKEMQQYCKDLNHLYKNEPSLWARDFEWQGFEWICGGDWQSSLVSYLRKNDNYEDAIIVLVNFTPVPHTQRRTGVPCEGEYIEIFNSDQHKYGGSGIINYDPIKTEKIEWDGRENSIMIQVPPLGVTMLKLKK